MQAGTPVHSTDHQFGNGSTATGPGGVDAQYGANVTWDYYKTVHGRNGISATATARYNRVHYGSELRQRVLGRHQMTYGDGDGTNFGPLVSLDIAGHEMCHGVTQTTAGLIYSGESGGLNEATSDIFGTMVEFYANNANDPPDYLIGEKFDLAQHAGLPPDVQPDRGRHSPNCYSDQHREPRRALLVGRRATTSSTCWPRARREDHQRRRAQLPTCNGSR